ncbi:MAG: YicC family protein [Alteromonadaceae bacterium]|nr:YicC family protein [Alteromonadaceae bacterium]
MIYSMTAFARRELKADWGSAVWEIRSVNQRYLETSFRLVEQFRGLEPVLRERFRKSLQRGKVECTLRFMPAPGASSTLNVNQELAAAVIAAAESLPIEGPASLSRLEVLQWPGVVASAEADMDAINAQLLAEFDLTLADFISSRADEGENLGEMIEQRLLGIEGQVALVTERMPEVLAWQQDKIRSRFEEAKIELDSARVEQELVLLAQKVDVAEELERLISHVGETRKILQKGGAVGRRLDFMMQEFNRESNTLGSKSISAEITLAAVELKVLIEQMREQIQNIE